MSKAPTPIKARKAATPVLDAPATTVPAAARTMALFEVFAREKRELAKSELARMLDLPESSCSDLLNTLHAIGYVARTATSKRYYPTGRLSTISTAIALNDPLGAFGAEASALLSQRTGETSTFGVLDGDGVKLLSVNEGTHRLRYVVAAGYRVSLHATSVGKALLGALDDAEVARLLRLKPLKSFTESTHTDPKEIEAELKRSRADGWYTATEEGGVGISSYAVSALLDSGPVALSVIGPTDRLLAQKDEYIEILRDVQKIVFSGAETPSTHRR
jgi:DNA-binding IclR family transcriptional regulator